MSVAPQHTSYQTSPFQNGTTTPHFAPPGRRNVATNAVAAADAPTIEVELNAPAATTVSATPSTIHAEDETKATEPKATEPKATEDKKEAAAPAKKKKAGSGKKKKAAADELQISG